MITDFFVDWPSNVLVFYSIHFLRSNISFVEIWSNKVLYTIILSEFKMPDVWHHCDIVCFRKSRHHRVHRGRTSEALASNVWTKMFNEPKRTNEGQISTKVVMKMHENSFSIMNMTSFLYLTLHHCITFKAKIKAQPIYTHQLKSHRSITSFVKIWTVVINERKMIADQINRKVCSQMLFRHYEYDHCFIFETADKCYRQSVTVRK